VGIIGTPIRGRYSERMLTPSAGKWVRQLSIRTQLVTGTDISQVDGNRMIGAQSGASATIDHVEFYRYLNYDVYDIYFDETTLSSEFVPYENVTIEGLSGIVFNIFPVFSKAVVLRSGTGYNQ